MREVSGSSGRSLNFVAVFAASLEYASRRSLAEAAFRSVSSVMYVFLIQSAVDDSTSSRLRSSFTFATNCLGSDGEACCTCALLLPGDVCCAAADAHAASAAAATTSESFMAAQAT